MKLKIGLVIVYLLTLGSIFATVTCAKNIPEAKDVKYYFDNLEPFRENLPRGGIQKKVLLRGRIVEFEVDVVCEKSPCPPVKMIAIEDINEASYRIIIYDGNLLVKQFKIGQIYILQGVLDEGADFGRKEVYISNFDPQKIVVSGNN